MKFVITKFRYAVLGAVGYVFEYRNKLAKALLIPFLLYLALDVATYIQPIPVVAFGVSIMSIFVHSLFAITTHRIILLGPESVPKWGILSWSKRETSFALHLVGISLMLIPITVLAFIPTIGMALIIPTMFWLLGRLSLVFPGIAIDQAISYKHSWKLTKNNQILMMLVVILFPVLLLIPSKLISTIPYTFFISSALSTLCTVFMVAALSITYKELSIEALDN